MTKTTRKNCLARIYHYLNEHKSGTTKEISKETNCSFRQVSLVLQRLIESNEIRKARNFKDARIFIYYVIDKKREISHLDELQNKARNDFHADITKLNLMFGEIKFKAVDYGKQIGLYCVKDKKRNLVFFANDYIRASRKLIDMSIMLTAIFI